MRSLFSVSALVLSACVSGLALSHRDFNTTLPTREIHQFPNETWLENLAVRQNGQILVSVLTAPELYQVDPFHTNSSPALIHRIPGATGLLAIVELQQDVFYVIAGNFSLETFQTTTGSYSIWKIDLCSSKVLDGSLAIASKVTDIPEGVLLNGMAVLNKLEGLVVIGDAGAGVVFTLNVKTRKYSKTIEDPTMNPAGSLHLGIDGLKIRGGYLYYTTIGQELFSRIPINSSDGTAVGPAEVIERSFLGDDFSFDRTGNAYIAQNSQNTVAKVTPDGMVTVVAGSLNSTLVAGATATAFGRTQKDHYVIYVTTSGGFGSPVQIEGGKVVAIYT